MRKSKIYVLGSINLDFNIKVEEIPKQGQTVKGIGFLQNLGGKGFNQANAINSLGYQTILISAVGNDNFGKRAVETINKKGIIALIKTKSQSTGIAFITRSKTDNFIVVNSGANDLFNQNDLDFFNNAKKGDYLVAQFELPVNVVKESFIKAKEIGMFTVLNASPAYPLLVNFCKLIDYLVINQTEAFNITGIYPNEKETILHSANILLSKGVKNVLITLGKHGCAFINKNNFIIKDSYPTKVVDTTGAGDSLIGGFIHGLMSNYPIEDVLDYANASGSYTCTKEGVEDAMPTLEQIKQIIKGEKNR